MLQTRSGKRTAKAALRIATDMVREKLISEDEAVMRVDPAALEQLLHPTLDPKAPKELIASGLAASPGAASGEVVFTADEAERTAADGHDVILVARSEAKLQALAIELRQFDVKVFVIPCDLSKPNAARDLYDAVVAAGHQVDWLVNNAGVGMYGDIGTAPIEEQQQLLALNVTAPTLLTRLFLEGMEARKRGRVLNISSVGAFQPVPSMALYAATKSYVQDLSVGIAAELRWKKDCPVRLTVCAPGATATEFAATANVQDAFMWRWGPTLGMVATADAVAIQAFEASCAGDDWVCPMVMDWVAVISAGLMPYWATNPIAAKIMG